MYFRYNYFLERKNNGDFQVVARAGEHSGNVNYIWLGKWYAHEKTPFVDGDKVVRMRYGKKIILVENCKEAFGGEL